jgi:hypothetical protein
MVTEQRLLRSRVSKFCDWLLLFAAVPNGHIIQNEGCIQSVDRRYHEECSEIVMR